MNDSERATLDQLAEECESVLGVAEKYNCLVRASELQNSHIGMMRELKDRIKRFKYGAIQIGEERAANILFQYQCVINAKISMMSMWIEMKKENYHEAWRRLIDAQEYAAIASLVDNEIATLSSFIESMVVLEKTLFPKNIIYNSWGAIVKGVKCNICGKDLAECVHLEGLVYMGRLCQKIVTDIVEIDHFSITAAPVDKRCIHTEIGLDDGHFYDIMTWKKTDIEPREDVGPMVTKALMFRIPDLEID